MVIIAALGKSEFNCERYEAPPRPSNDISKLNPVHIDLTMAMGDSISAAFAARGGLREDRDIAWSDG